MDKFLVIPEQEQEVAKNNLGLDDFEILSTIGKGGYGFVAKVKSKRDHKIYAMKMIDFNKIKDQREITLSMNEIKLIQRLDSPHIIKYYHSFLVSNKLYIIMEFMSNKDLEGFIRAYMEIGKPIPYEEVLELFYQCAAGLCYCHKKNIIHRDIKPANLFMTDTKDVKIGDFGISAAKKIRGELNTLTIGTPKYMAPEMFKNTGYDSKIDVYALGCTFHILCYFSLPRDIKIFNFNGVQRGEIVDVNPTCFKNWNFYPQEIKDLIYQMIDRNPQVRLSSGIVFNKIKDLYNKNKRQNSSIACAYNGLYSFKNFTTYLESQKGNISQQLEQKPISNSFTYYTSNLSLPNQEEVLKNLRDVLTYENSSFPDPGQIDPIDIIKYILKKIHLETNTGTLQNIDIYGNSIQNYLQNLQYIKSCILDFFFGTFQTDTTCFTCKQTSTRFTNYYQLTFDIEQAFKTGIIGNNYLANYFTTQNNLCINTSGICPNCKQQAYFQQKKKIFSLPYNLVICFKGEKNNYNNQYISYNMDLNLSQLGLNSSPGIFHLKAIIKCTIVNEEKNYISIYLDPKVNQWFLSNGYTKQAIPSPAFHNVGDVIALFYSSV